MKKTVGALAIGAIYFGMALEAHAQLAVAALPAGPDGAGDGGNPQTEEIIVTSRKRSENLQAVPIAISAFTPSMFDRQQMTNLKDLSAAVPDLEITRNQTTANSAQVFLRGIGQDDSTPTNEPGVGIYVDDVYVARSQGALLDLIDLDRIEVLRGPQGTLYGRNSSGGAIKFVSHRPSLTDVAGKAELDFGSFGEIDGKASISAPVVDNVMAVKLDFLAVTNDGYERRVDTGQEINRTDRKAGRLALLYKPNDMIEAYLTADGTYDRSGLQQPTPVIAGTRAPLYGDSYTTNPGSKVPDINNYEGYGLAGTLVVNLEPITIKSITAFRLFNNAFIATLTGRPNKSILNRTLHDNQTSQEIQVSTNDLGPIKVTAGLYYLSEDFNNHDIFLLDTRIHQNTDSVATYAEGSYAILPDLNVTLGARYTYDNKSIDVSGRGLGGLLGVSTSKSFYNISEKVGLDYHPTRDITTYFTFSTGYKAGAFQGFPQSNAEVTGAILRPEKVDAFEVGFKGDFFDHRLRINEALFHTDYHALQLAIFNPATLGFVARNADADIYGTETEISATPLSGLSVYANLSTFQSHYLPGNPNDPLLPSIHDRLKFMPDVAYRLGFDYSFPEQAFGTFAVAGNYTWQDKTFFAFSSAQPTNYQGAYGLIDIQGSFESPDGHYKLIAAAKNLGNQVYATTGTVSGGGAFYYSPGRTFSISLRASL